MPHSLRSTGAHVGLSPGDQVEGPSSFRQWYVNEPGVNQRFELMLDLTEDRPGHFVYDSDAFFPIDNMGFGNEGNAHNYHFTTELRTEVTYGGGEATKRVSCHGERGHDQEQL